MAAPDYVVQVRDLDQVVIAEIAFSDLEYNFSLNDIGTCGFSMPLKHPQCTPEILAVKEREILVLRNGVRVWGGILGSATADSSVDDVKFAADGWLILLEDRYIKTTQEFTDEDQLSIAWALIDYANSVPNGDTGITRLGGVTGASGILRSARFPGYERPNILAALMELTKLSDGFDFEVDANKKWTTYYPERGVDRTGSHTFELGVNVSQITYAVDGYDIVSEVSGMGGGEGRSRCIATWRATDSIARFGLIQEAADFGDIRHYDIVSKRTREYLRRRKNPRAQPTVVVQGADPAFNSYGIGDRVKAKADLGYITFNKNVRCVARKVKLEKEGYEDNTLYLDDVPITTDEEEI